LHCVSRRILRRSRRDYHAWQRFYRRVGPYGLRKSRYACEFHKRGAGGEYERGDANGQSVHSNLQISGSVLGFDCRAASTAAVVPMAE
jgi:hypothetical protein